MAVDEEQGIISHIQVDFADRRDSTLLPNIIEPLNQRLLAQELPVEEVVADTTYANGLNYALLEARGITPWIPIFGQYKPEIEGFTFDKEVDCFLCPAGKPLPFKHFAFDPDGRFSKRYSAATGDYRRCPCKPTCIPKARAVKLSARPTMPTTAIRCRSQRMCRLRQCTAEPVFGSLLQYYGLRRVNTRGRSSAYKNDAAHRRCLQSQEAAQAPVQEDTTLGHRLAKASR